MLDGRVAKSYVLIPRSLISINKTLFSVNIQMNYKIPCRCLLMSELRLL